jgi:hypothetical protein
MDNELRLGYQAAMVSLHSPTYGRLWLSVVPHPGNTASCTQVEAMVVAAEAKTSLRPLRRTDLLRDRLQDLIAERQGGEEQVQTVEAALTTAQGQAAETGQQIDPQRTLVAQLEAEYGEKQRL